MFKKRKPMEKREGLRGGGRGSVSAVGVNYGKIGAICQTMKGRRRPRRLSDSTERGMQKRGWGWEGRYLEQSWAEGTQSLRKTNPMGGRVRTRKEEQASNVQALCHEGSH